MNKKSKIIIWIVVGVVAVLLLGILFSDMFDMTAKTLSEFMTLLKEDPNIKEISFDAYEYFALDGGGRVLYSTVGPSVYGYADFEVFRDVAMNEYGVDLSKIAVSFTDPNAGSFLTSLMPLLGVVLVAVMFWMIMRSAAGGGGQSAMSIGKSKAHMQSNLKVRFSDVAGAEEEKEELAEIVEFLKSPKKFSSLGARIPSGVLLVGPPGTGKTLFAKAVAGEAGVPFFSVSGSDFVEMYVGVGAKRVRDLFDMAKKSQPCIIFID